MSLLCMLIYVLVIFHYFAIRSAKVHTLAKALSPSYLRFGGTDADTLLFDDELAQDKSQTYKKNLMQGNDQVIYSYFIPVHGVVRTYSEVLCVTLWCCCGLLHKVESGFRCLYGLLWGLHMFFHALIHLLGPKEIVWKQGRKVKCSNFFLATQQMLMH